MKCPLTRTRANFISHRARRDISQCAPAHYFTFCGSKTFHYMHLCPQMQCLSRKKDEEFLQFFVLFLLVGVSFFNALSQVHPVALFCLIIMISALLTEKKKATLKGFNHKAGFELPNKEKGVRTILFVLLFTRLACKV